MLFRRGFFIRWAFVLEVFFIRSISCQFLWDRIFAPAGNLSPPQDCLKEWGNCYYTGSNPSAEYGAYYREEIAVVPAQNGGSCSLSIQRFCDASCNTLPPCNAVKRDCIKNWSDCFGSSSNSYRIEVEIEPAQNGGKCELRYEFGCNTAIDCTKRWGKCEGNGPKSMRTEIIVTQAKNGGKCELKREFGCNPRVDCTKRWGKCEGNGPKSVRREIIVTPAKNGGKCEVRREFGCNPRVDCTKRWGRCEGIGPKSVRREIIVTPAKNGGKCELRREFGCNPKVDCTKRWGKCEGNGPTSVRREIIVTQAKNGGKCELKTEFGCNEDANPPRKDEDDTPGKKVASLLIANFVVDSVESPTKPKPSTGARSLSFQTPVFSLERDTNKKINNTKNNCTELKDGENIIAIGCDDADDIDPKIIAEERKLKVRVGEKQRNKTLGRTKRAIENTQVSKPPTPRDVLFLLDSSGSVGQYHFEVMKDVCKAIVDVLCGRISLGKYQTRIAMATFNRRQLISFPFSKTADVGVIKKKIGGVQFDYVYSFQSCIRDALQFVLTDVYLEENGARDPSYAEGDMFIITDGCANCDFSENNKELQRMAYRLKLNRINVYAIGIGMEENCRDILKVLARGGRCFHFFFLDDWDVDVRDFLHRLKNPPQDRCLDRWEFPGINCLENRKG